MTLFRESGLSFQFDAFWVVKKYDAHRYYSYLSGAGLKAIDFAGVREEKVYLFEVKNYSIRYEGKPFYKIYELINDPEQLVDTIVYKVQDTSRGIKIVHDYLSRKWLYRRLYPWLIKWPLQNWGKNTWWFWAKLYHMLEERQQAVVVLWIEVDTQYEGYEEARVKTFLKVMEKRLGEEIPKLGLQFVLASVENGIKVQGLVVKS